MLNSHFISINSFFYENNTEKNDLLSLKTDVDGILGQTIKVNESVLTLFQVSMIIDLILSYLVI